MTGSWGNYPKPKNTTAKPVLWQDQTALFDQLPVLPYGNGRSYGDQCLNDDGVILQTKALNRLMAFDNASGVLRCEAGALLSDIYSFCIPRGWTLPVVPGTKYITVGGAIANDVHGKNHHVRGTFGKHVVRFALLRSDGQLIECSQNENVDLYRATIAGLGLTGLIVWADIQLMRQTSQYLTSTTIPFYGLKDFFHLSLQAEQSHEYTVAWLDCQAKGDLFGRGLFMQANYNDDNRPAPKAAKKRGVPCFLPSLALNSASISAFNHLYFYKGTKASSNTVHYDPFFFPLDSLLNWNRIYGKPGFVQYQCVIPLGHGLDTITELLKAIVQSKQGSFLSVLKVFGDVPSPGLLSFPMPGVTLALDFPQRGDKTFELLNRLDDIVMAAKGRVYCAKDARMQPKHFQAYYGHALDEFKQHKDPGFSSGLWRRLTEDTYA